MAFWSRFLGFGSSAGRRVKGLQGLRPSYSNSSAVSVSLDGALQLSAVWACVKIITESIASLPINIYNVSADGTRTLNTDHPLAILFNGKVNRWQTKNEFFETYVWQKVLLGNSYAVIQRGTGGKIIGLTPLMTEQMQVALDDSGAIEYKYTNGTEIKMYSDKSVWHSKLFGNGITGLSPLGYARNSLGIAIATEDAVTSVYRSGGKPSGILTIDKLLTDAQRARIKENFADMTVGNQSRLFVLEAGMNYNQVSLSPQDIELLQSRRFNIEDIARFFGVPSVLINDSSANTAWGSGIQQIVQGFYKFGLRPYLERLEASMKCWLLTQEERVTMDIEFDFNALLQPDMDARIKTYSSAIQGGIMTINEARAEEGWKPIAGGDNAYMQQQMWPLAKLADPARVESANTPTPKGSL